MDLDGAGLWIKVGERLNANETRIARIEGEIARAKTLLTRVGLVALIWTAGLIAKLPSETVGEHIAGLLKGALK